MKKFAPLILVAGLALTGCAPKALEVAPGPSHVPAGAPVAVAVAEPSQEAIVATPTPTPSAPHVPVDTGIKFTGATPELKALAIQDMPNGMNTTKRTLKVFEALTKPGMLSCSRKLTTA